MKTKNTFKTLAFAMLMPAMLLTTACSNINENEEPDKKGHTLPITVNVARQGDEATTKATYNDGTKKLSFSEGDKLFVCGENTSTGAGKFAGTLTWNSGGTFSGTITTENKYTGTADALFTATNSNDYVEAELLPAGYGTYGFFSISENDGYDAELLYDYAGAFAIPTDEKTAKVLAVEQFSYEWTTEYSGGFVLNPYSGIFNFSITGLTASQTNVGVSLTGPQEYEVTGSVTTDESGKATFAVGVFGGAYSPAFCLTVGGKKIPLMLSSSDTKIHSGKIYNISRSPLFNAFVDGNKTSFAFYIKYDTGSLMGIVEGDLTLSATYSDGSFGDVTNSGMLALAVSSSNMTRNGNDLVITIAVNIPTVGTKNGSMTIDTVNNTYSWSNDEVGSMIALTSITIGSDSINPLPTLVQ